VRFRAQDGWKIERMDRGAILGQSKMAKPRVPLKQGDNFCSSSAQRLRWLPVGQHDGFRFRRHLQDHPVVFRTHRIVHFQQSSFVRGAISMDVSDELAPVAPIARERPGLSERRVAVINAGHTGIHEKPQDKRSAGIPYLPELIAVLFAVRKHSADRGVRRPRRSGFSSRIMLLDDA